MTTVLYDDDTQTRPLAPALAQAIKASFSELHRLTEELTDDAAQQRRPESLVLDLPLPTQGSVELATQVQGNHDIDVLFLAVDGATALSRTERREDRFDLDLNVSLVGLDQFELKTVKRALTRLRSFVAAARQENSDARITQLLRAVAPPDPLGDVELNVAEMSADLRREFLEQVPLRTSAQVHERAGFPGGNPSQTVHRWRKQGKIFSVHHGGREWYPAFQFGEDGRPRPIIAELLAILHRDTERTEWDNALWFSGDSGWLDGKTPIEMLVSDPDSVKRAAEQEVLRDEQ